MYRIAIYYMMLLFEMVFRCSRLIWITSWPIVYSLFFPMEPLKWSYRMTLDWPLIAHISCLNWHWSLTYVWPVFSVLWLVSGCAVLPSFMAFKIQTYEMKDILDTTTSVSIKAPPSTFDGEKSKYNKNCFKYNFHTILHCLDDDKKDDVRLKIIQFQNKLCPFSTIIMIIFLFIHDHLSPSLGHSVIIMKI